MTRISIVDNNDTDDLPPPLEDMTEELAAAGKLSNQNCGDIEINQNNVPCTAKDSPNMTHSANKPNESSSCKVSTENKKPPRKASSSSGGTSGFAGMSKGFLFGGNSGTKCKKQPVVAESLRKNQNQEEPPLIKSQPQNSSLRFKEVQEANPSSWMTDNLINNVTEDESLMKQLADPKYAAVLEEFQKNLTEAMKKYAHDKDVEAFFMKFMSIFGNHFSKMPANSPKQEEKSLIEEVVDPETERMNEILAKPNVRSALEHEDMKRLFHCLKHEPEKAQELLHTHRFDRDFQNRVRVLCENGLLQFAS